MFFNRRFGNKRNPHFLSNVILTYWSGFPWYHVSSICVVYCSVQSNKKHWGTSAGRLLMKIWNIIVTRYILRIFFSSISVPNCENEGRKLIWIRYKLQYQLNLCTVRFTNSVDWFLFYLGPIGSWKDYVLPTWICKSCTVCSYLISCTYLATYHI